MKNDFPEKIDAQCPTCQQTGTFVLLGIQEWEACVAEKSGLPAIIALYTCPHCETTISHLRLMETDFAE